MSSLTVHINNVGETLGTHTSAFAVSVGSKLAGALYRLKSNTALCVCIKLYIALVCCCALLIKNQLCCGLF